MFKINGKVRKVSGRCAPDIAADHRGAIIDIKSFGEASAAARPRHEKERRRLGFVAAEKARYERLMAEHRTFKKLMAHVPRSLDGAAAQAKYTLAYLRNELRAVDRSESQYLHSTYEDRAECESAIEFAKFEREGATRNLEALLRSVAKAKSATIPLLIAAE